MLKKTVTKNITGTKCISVQLSNTAGDFQAVFSWQVQKTSPIKAFLAKTHPNKHTVKWLTVINNDAKPDLK